MCYLMYPKVFVDFDAHRKQFGDTSVLPSDAFFFGAAPAREIAVDIDPGKRLLIKFITVGESDVDGEREVFFELNGQPRSVRVLDQSLGTAAAAHIKADPDKPEQVPAPMPGKVATIVVSEGHPVEKGEKLLSLEAMKMETSVFAPMSGKVAHVHVKPGSTVQAQDLLMTIEPAKG